MGSLLLVDDDTCTETKQGCRHWNVTTKALFDDNPSEDRGETLAVC